MAAFWLVLDAKGPGLSVEETAEVVGERVEPVRAAATRGWRKVRGRDWAHPARRSKRGEADARAIKEALSNGQVQEDTLMDARARLHEQPLGEEFDAFVQDRDLFEHDHFRTVEKMLEGLGVDPGSETAYLATFAYTAGGWTPEVARRLIGDHGVDSLEGAVEAAEESELDELGDIATSHSHRRHHYDQVDKALATLDRLGADSFTGWAEGLKGVENRVERFRQALDDVRSVDTIGEVSSFDWLELVVRVQNQTWIGPDRFHDEVFEGGKPGDGFELVFDLELGEPGTEEAYEILEDYGEILGLRPVEAVFDLESCLCVFATLSDEDLEGLSMGGAGADIGHSC